jgi:hypothetical protein
VEAIRFDPQASGVIYAVQADAPYRSTDAGGSWSALAGFPFTAGATFAMPPARPHRIYATLYGDLQRSDDEGATWARLGVRTNTATSVIVTPDRADSVYVLNAFATSTGRKAALHASTDAGVSWSQLGAGVLPDQLTLLALDPRDDATMFAAAPIRQLAVVLGFDQDARNVRSSGFLDQGSVIRVAQDPTGALYALATKDAQPLLIKLR